MGVLQNKIDFEGIIVVENANCNGDHFKREHAASYL